MRAGVRAGGVVDAVLPSRRSGNTVPTLTLKISKQLRSQIASAAKRRGITQSELVRQAIESTLRAHQPVASAYDRISDLIGIYDGPGDLSTNKKYMEGFGLDGASLWTIDSDFQIYRRHGRQRIPTLTP